MLRRLHSLPGLFAALLVSLLAITGALLAFDSLADRAVNTVPAAGRMNVADLAGAVQARHAEVERIMRSASGAIIVHYFENDMPGAERVDPMTGQSLGPHEPSGFTRWVTNLHRSFFLGDAGRAAAGIGAAAMLVLCVSGVLLLAGALGGWRALARPVRGGLAQRLHGEIGRLAVLGLLLSALTGGWMSLTTFGVLPDGALVEAASSVPASGGERLPPGQLAGLRVTDLLDLRELTFPYGADLAESYTLVTSHGVAHVDAATGHILDTVPNGWSRSLHETILMLHTGRGIWPLALLLGVAALCAPLLAGAGGVIWWRRRANRPRLRGNVAAQDATTIILVGSEGQATWGFAATLHAALTAAGQAVHVAPMNSLLPRHDRAQRLVILTSTHGDGAAPASARQFMARLAGVAPAMPVAVLGFGDRSFPKFCGYASEVAVAMQARGWPSLLPASFIDRQSAEEFARWGEALGAAMGVALTLRHVARRPATRTLQLATRQDFGAETQAPTSILRFVAPRRSRFWAGRLARFEAGDLVGILAPGSDRPRFYSLASSSRDGLLEICVRKQAGGVCSGFLHGLEPGARIEGFIRANPGFRPGQGSSPVVLIGAGAGIAPLAGFVRGNRAARPMHLYWGGRHPASDFLYEAEMKGWLRDHRLAGLHAIFSRVAGGGYVQDRLTEDADALRGLITQGARIMVCGGRGMAAGVATAMAGILAPLGLDLAGLKAEGRYLEDVY